eukprot:GHVU01026886.1.p2 GENE.GHVU01026886.1~~GHVU01026886.1.p2  ORF type:complete len:123 (-),score=7.17 GHVU01026886.1:77-445(-)
MTGKTVEDKDGCPLHRSVLQKQVVVSIPWTLNEVHPTGSSNCEHALVKCLSAVESVLTTTLLHTLPSHLSMFRLSLNGSAQFPEFAHSQHFIAKAAGIQIPNNTNAAVNFIAAVLFYLCPLY